MATLDFGTYPHKVNFASFLHDIGKNRRYYNTPTMLRTFRFQLTEWFESPLDLFPIVKDFGIENYGKDFIIRLRTVKPYRGWWAMFTKGEYYQKEYITRPENDPTNEKLEVIDILKMVKNEVINRE